MAGCWARACFRCLTLMPTAVGCPQARQAAVGRAEAAEAALTTLQQRSAQQVRGARGLARSMAFSYGCLP